MFSINTANLKRFRLSFWYSLVFNMWLPLTLLILAGAVAADYEHGWKVGHEYTYLVRSRTLTALDTISEQYTGILLKALLTVQAKDENTLVADVSKCQYVHIHTDLPDGWDSEISDQGLEFRHLPLSGRPFQIKIKHGLIRDLIVDRDIPTWELNILKSIVSQLQVDSQGENAIRTKGMTMPNDEEPYGMFHAMEDSVGGKCEVLYDITPLPEHMVYLHPELVPKPELKGEGMFIDIMKTKNFTRCDQRVDYHFGITGSTNWEPGSNDNGNFLSKSSNTRTILSGNLKSFVIQSSVTTSKMHVSPRFYDHQNGIVVSMMNLTLANKNRIKSELPTPRNPESTGNLVYVYNNPFSDSEDRRTGKREESLNSNQLHISDSMNAVSSSEEKDKQRIKIRGSESSASSSSISSSEENQFWQPKPTMEEAPQFSLLPNFVGYKGKFIGKSDQINLVDTTKTLVVEIAQAIDDSGNGYAHEYLEQFTILSELMRTMSRKQLMDAERTLKISLNEIKSNDKSQAVKQNIWAVFRDAVAQAGTGPALLTIKSWIEKGDIDKSEAADVIARIPKNARAPTAEYVKTLFELASSPKVKQDDTIGTATILAFTELVRLSQINGRTIHNRYPVHTFGRLTSKHDQTVVEEYIPYLERELKKAIEKKNSRWIQTYTVALGNIGHSKILSVFEPYLEGKQPVTVFQRTLMVASLSKLAAMNPKLARSVLYKIYLNTMESHEVRCMAVYLLMSTKPPLSMLQRMADYTKYDTNKQVNSAVKSSIESLAYLVTPQYKDIANRARIAMNLLSTADYDYELSHSFVKDSAMEEGNMMQRTIFNYIGSEDSVIPHSMYYGFFSSFGGFNTPPDEIIAMISNVNPLLKRLLKFKDDEPSGKTRAEKIVEELKIVPEAPVPFEGNLMINSKFISHFIPFDDPRDLPNAMVKLLRSMKNQRYTNFNMLMSYDVTLSFPTETGLPFLFDFHVPILYKLTGQNQVKVDDTLNVNVNLNNRILYARKIQGRIGFVTPFEHQQFVSGVDVNLQAYVPIKVDLEVSPMLKTAKVNIWPLKGAEKAQLIHFSVVPYTSIHNILSLRPLTQEKDTHRVVKETVSNVKLIPKNMEPFRLDVEADEANKNFWSLDFLEDENMFSFPWGLITDEYCKIDLFLNLKHELEEPLAFTVSMNSMNVQPGSEDPEQWTPLAMVVEPSDKTANSEKRKNQFLKEVSKGIKAAKSEVLDIELKLPGVLESNMVTTIAWSDNNLDSKERSLLYWKFNVPNKDFNFEICAASKATTTTDILPSYEQATKTIPRQDFDVAISFGESCSSSNELNIKGKLLQSKNMKNAITKLAVIKECQEQMKHGNKMLEACQAAAAAALILDEMDISMDIKSPELLEIIDMFFDRIDDFDTMDLKVDTVAPKNADTNTIDINAKLSNDLEKVVLTVYTPTMDISNDIDLDSLGMTYKDLILPNEGLSDKLLNTEIGQSCVIDKTRTLTFDGKEYSTKLGKCWHTVMTTYPNINPKKPDEKLPIPEDMTVTILARDTDDGTREAKILLGDDEIVLLSGSSWPEVKVNGNQIVVTKERSYQKREDQDDDEQDAVFEIVRLVDGSIGLTSDEYGISVAYDGTRILIETSGYGKSVRGLCGNSDGDETNDFVGPKNCILRKPEEFIASYALTKEECEGESMKLAKRVNKFECIHQEKNRQRNVINDVEAGRASIESNKWGYHSVKKDGNERCSTHRTQVIEEGDKICFTTRPIFACAANCSASETASKIYQFHCMERSEAAYKMKKRVEKGANPDLSQKPVSMSRSVNVPIACKA
ncbi:vitellogenin isoform X2 [Ptiloglossa arizonensis]|uniref:vitellogenin isoform X2 n=1 Tax=Ptiloglossa arizonensis TaxID=3350558 RepID=UPI003F9EE3C5